VKRLRTFASLLRDGEITLVPAHLVFVHRNAYKLLTEALLSVPVDRMSSGGDILGVLTDGLNSYLGAAAYVAEWSHQAQECKFRAFCGYVSGSKDVG
jgi:hypothetical protein